MSKQLSKHFNSDEFACQCGCGYMHDGEDVSPKLIQLLEKMRTLCGGIPLEINSGCRCPKHNADVGGVSNSQHVLGKAADIDVPKGMTPKQLGDIGWQAGAKYVQVYSSWVHVDVRD